jgi:hypothetical protein
VKEGLPLAGRASCGEMPLFVITHFPIPNLQFLQKFLNVAR